MNLPHIAYSQVLGEVVRRQRRRAGHRQEDLAAEAGLSPSAWSRIEAGKTAVSVVQLRRIAEVLGVPIAEILQEADDLWEQIGHGAGGVEAVEGTPQKDSSAGWFLGGAAVGALVAGLLAGDSKRRG